MKIRLPIKTLILLLIIVLLGAAVYSNTLDVPFQFDDAHNITQNPYITDLNNVPSMFFGKKGAWASRPLLQATVAVNFHYGGFETRGYHILNIAIHLINGVFLYLLVTLTARHMRYDERKARMVAFFSALLFVLHPVNTETVNSIVNRSMLFATMFYLMGLIFYLRSVTAGKGRGFYVGGLFFASLLGMASRENFATFPVMLLAYDLFFVSGFRFREFAGRWKTYLPVVLSLGYMALLVMNNTYDRVLSKGIPPVHYVLTQMNVHWTYIRLILLPLNLNVDYDYRTAKTIFELPTIVSSIGYMGLWAGVLVLAKRRPLVSFSILWFVVTLLPISLLVAFTGVRLGDVIFEHRLYLPAVAFFPVLVAGIFSVFDRVWFKKPVAAGIVLCVVIAVIFSIATYERNISWRSEVGLWRDVVAKSPNKSRPRYNLARFLSRADGVDEAMAHYKIAIKLDPSDYQAHFNIGVLYLQRGYLNEARMEFERTLQLNPNHREAPRFLKYVNEQQK